MLEVGDEDVGCPVVDPAEGCGVVVVASVVCSRLSNRGYKGSIVVVVEGVEALNSSRSCGYCGRSLQLPSVDSVEV